MQTNQKAYLKSWLEQESYIETDITLPQNTMRAVKDIKDICNGGLGTARSIDTFFAIIKHSEVDRHSNYREDFWRQHLELGHIFQSWLILAPKAAHIAQHTLNVRPQQYATIEKSRKVDDAHAILLSRLSNIIVAEWSHTGKCRFWHQSSKHCPKLFQKNYSRNELIEYADHIQQHYFSAKGLWQKDANKWLAANMNLT